MLIPDSALAAEAFEKAAQAGMVPAQCALGELLLSDDWEVRNPQSGMKWLECAWQNGSLRAGYHLAKEYLSGGSVTKDMAQGVEHLSACADAGHPGAQYLLGKLYLTGQEVPQDVEQAEYWLSQAAAQGNEYAGLLLERLDKPKIAGATVTLYQLHPVPAISSNGAQGRCSASAERRLLALPRAIQRLKILLIRSPRRAGHCQSQ